MSAPDREEVPSVEGLMKTADTYCHGRGWPSERDAVEAYATRLFEAGRLQGIREERAVWNLTKSGEAIDPGYQGGASNPQPVAADARQVLLEKLADLERRVRQQRKHLARTNMAREVAAGLRPGSSPQQSFDLLSLILDYGNANFDCGEHDGGVGYAALSDHRAHCHERLLVELGLEPIQPSSVASVARRSATHAKEVEDLGRLLQQERVRQDRQLAAAFASARAVALGSSAAPVDESERLAGSTKEDQGGAQGNRPFEFLQQRVYAWLGYWRDQMPPKAVDGLQRVLGPLTAPSHSGGAQGGQPVAADGSQT